MINNCCINIKKNYNTIIRIFLSYLITLSLTLDKSSKITSIKTLPSIFINQDSMLCLIIFTLVFISLKNFNFANLKFSKRENIILNLFATIFALITTVGIDIVYHNGLFRNSTNIYSIIAFFIVILVYFVVFNFILKFLFYKFKDTMYEETLNKKNNFNLKFYIKLLLPILIIRIIFFIIFFPGNFTWDSMYSVKEGIGVLPLSNSHPYLYIYILGIFGKLGLKMFSSVGIGIGIFNFINVIITSNIIAFVLYKIFEFKFSNKLKVFLYLYFCINPYFIIYSFTVYKDVALGNFLLLFILILILMIFKPNNFFSNKLSILYFCIVIFGVIMLHRKAIIYIVVGLLSMLIYTKKEFRLKTLIYISLSILLCFSGNFMFKKILSPEESFRKYDYLSTRFQQLASVVYHHPDSFSKKELELVDEIYDINRIKNDFSFYDSDPIKNWISNEEFGELKNDFLKLWYKMYLKHPKTNIDTLLNLSISYFYPYNQAEGIWLEDYYEYMYKNSTNWFEFKTFDKPSNLTLKNKYGYFDKNWKQNTNFTEIHKFQKIVKKFLIYNINDYPVISSFLKVGFITWILLLLICYNILIKNKNVYPLLFLAISIVLSCIYSPIVNYYRYSYLIFISVPLIIPFTFIKIKNNKDI